MSEHGNHALARTDPMPYYTLRGFLDAEYGVIITLAFVKFVELAAGILTTIISQRTLDKLTNWKLAEAATVFKATVTYGPFGEMGVSFLQSIGSFIFMFICFIMLVDDYYQARVLSFWAPCRTIRRFAMDVAIGFTFGATLLAAYNQSYLAGLFLCVSYLIGAKWGRQVCIEAIEWEQEQNSNGLGAYGQFGAKTTNWRLFRSRLGFINNSHEIIASALIFVSVVFYYIKSEFEIDNLYFIFSIVTTTATWFTTNTFMSYEHQLIEKIRGEINNDLSLSQAEKEVAIRQIVVLDSMFWLVLTWLPRKLKEDFHRRFNR